MEGASFVFVLTGESERIRFLPFSLLPVADIVVEAAGLDVVDL